MSNLLDTLLNIEVLGFIALLVWLYFKDMPNNERLSERETNTNAPEQKN